MKTKITKLKNGIRVVLVCRPDSKMISTNVFVGAGGRYEEKDTYGISHFLEHMLFKGTKKYPTSQDFSKKIESVGGLLNAWTSEDHTAYWNMVPSEHSEIGFEMLAEQISVPLLSEKEITTEKGVIIEEIRRSHDDPLLFIIHRLNGVLWPNHPMESDVLGPEENIKKLGREDFVSYMDSFYLSKNIITSVAGNIDTEKTLKQLERFFGSVKTGPKKDPLPMNLKQEEPKIELLERDLKQTHALFAYKTFGYDDKRNYALKVLSNILGGGMSSRLFEEIREKRGLAYSIKAGTDTFSDSGYFYVYGGFNFDKTEKALVAIQDVLDESKDVLFNERVSSAKEYIKGKMLYSLDSTEKISAWYGSRLMFAPEEIDPEITIEKINAVTPEEVRKVARDVFVPQNKNLIILGPYKNKEKFAKILSR